MGPPRRLSRRSPPAHARRRDKGTSRCPGVLTCGSQRTALAFPRPVKDAVALYERPLPAYSGVTVWAFHPLRVVTGETSVKAGEYSTLRLSGTAGFGIRDWFAIRSR